MQNTKLGQSLLTTKSDCQRDIFIRASVPNQTCCHHHLVLTFVPIGIDPDLLQTIQISSRSHPDLDHHQKMSKLPTPKLPSSNDNTLSTDLTKFPNPVHPFRALPLVQPTTQALPQWVPHTAQQPTKSNYLVKFPVKPTKHPPNQHPPSIYLPPLIHHKNLSTPEPPNTY